MFEAHNTMDTTESAVCTVIEPNADVSGTGIRASIYALCLGGRLLAFVTRLVANGHPSEEFERSYKNALGLQGMALLCTSWYQATHDQLTLFHAIVVIHLLALLGVNMASRISSKGPNKVRFFMNSFLVVCATATFIGFNVYVWVRAPDFGSQPECNDSVVYVLFGQSIQATNNVFRYIILATLAAPPAGFIIFLLIGAPCWVASCCFYRRHFRDFDPPSTTVTFEEDASSISEGKGAREFIQVMAYIAFSIYAIVSLEQMIKRNPVSEEETEWSFGQIIALFLLLGPTVDFMNAVVEGFRKTPSNDERVD